MSDLKAELVWVRDLAKDAMDSALAVHKRSRTYFYPLLGCLMSRISSRKVGDYRVHKPRRNPLILL